MRLFIAAILVAISYAQTDDLRQDSRDDPRRILRVASGVQEQLRRSLELACGEGSDVAGYNRVTDLDDKEVVTSFFKDFTDAATATDCASKCTSEEGCVAFSFGEGRMGGTFHCLLYNEDVTTADTIVWSGLVTYTRCPVEETSEETSEKEWVDLGQGRCVTKNGNLMSDEYHVYLNGDMGDAPLADCQKACADLGDDVCVGLEWEPSEKYKTRCRIMTAELLSTPPTGWTDWENEVSGVQSEITYAQELLGSFVVHCYAYKKDEDRSPCQENQLTYTYIPAADCPEEINEWHEEYDMSDYSMEYYEKNVFGGIVGTGYGIISTCNSKQITDILKTGIKSALCEWDDGNDANNGALTADSPNCNIYEVFQWSCPEEAETETLVVGNSASSHGDPIIWTFKGECYDLSKDGLYVASEHPRYNHKVWVGVYNDFIREIQITDEMDELLFSISNLNELSGEWNYGLNGRRRKCATMEWKECEWSFVQYAFDAQIFRYIVQIMHHDYLDAALKDGERGVHLDIYPKVYDNKMSGFIPNEYNGVYFDNPNPEELQFCPADSPRRY